MFNLKSSERKEPARNKRSYETNPTNSIKGPKPYNIKEMQ